MKDLSGLIEAGRLKSGTFSPKQVRERLGLAERDLATARRLLPEDHDWALSIAYNAMLQAARALMLHHGFRPAGEGQHVTVIGFLRLALAEEAQPLVGLMDRLRRKRNISVYDAAGTISATEATQAVESAEDFVGLIKGQVEV